MTKDDLPELTNMREWYILFPNSHPLTTSSFLLRTGEIVKGVCCADSATVLRWTAVYGDTYLGVGVFHG